MKLVNKNAIPEACELYKFLSNIRGKGIITGQHTQTKRMEEISYIKEMTGKLPAICGFELLSYSPNINHADASEACLLEVEENRGTLEEALDWAVNKGGILTFTWHWFSPYGGRDKSFYSEHTAFDASRVLLQDTIERKAFYHDMDAIAELLMPFLEKKIPILWRPFHESEGTWFWWGAKGPEVAKQLFRLMYAHFVGVKHLDNLIWVWNSPLKEGYPGDDVVDIISRDLYAKKGTVTDYQKEYKELKSITSVNKPAALAEIGILPDIDMLEEKGDIPWCYYMTWSKEFAIGEKFNTMHSLKKMYQSNYSIKLGDYADRYSLNT